MYEPLWWHGTDNKNNKELYWSLMGKTHNGDLDQLTSIKHPVSAQVSHYTIHWLKYTSLKRAKTKCSIIMMSLTARRLHPPSSMTSTSLKSHWLIRSPNWERTLNLPMNTLTGYTWFATWNSAIQKLIQPTLYKIDSLLKIPLWWWIRKTLGHVRSCKWLKKLFLTRFPNLPKTTK